MEYVVQSSGGNNFYTDDLEEALDIFNLTCVNAKDVELLGGEPGNYKVLFKKEF